MGADNQQRLAGHVKRSIGLDSLELPVLPHVAAQVLGLTQDEGADAQKLASLITRDQSLAAHVLRVANSAAFSATHKITSLQQAVARLGFNTLAEVALSASVGENVFRVAGHAPRIRRMWHTSLAAAAFSGLYVKMTRRVVDGAFLSGLLHGIGKPIVLKLSVQLIKRLRIPPRDIDFDAIIAEHHRPVSLAVMGRWQLPDPIAEAVGFHTDPGAAPTEPVAAALTGLAVHLATRLVDEEDERGEIDEALVAQLQLTADELDQLWGRRAFVSDAMQAMGV